MTKAKKEEERFDGLWIFMLLSLLFYDSPKPTKVINIYMEDKE